MLKRKRKKKKIKDVVVFWFSTGIFKEYISSFGIKLSTSFCYAHLGKGLNKMTTRQKYGDIEMKHASLRSQLNFVDVDEHLGVVDINGTLGFFLQTFDGSSTELQESMSRNINKRIRLFSCFQK